MNSYVENVYIPGSGKLENILEFSTMDEAKFAQETCISKQPLEDEEIGNQKEKEGIIY